MLLSDRPARVWVDQADFDSIVKAHGNRSWSWVEADRYVNLRPDQKRSVPIARLVVGNGDRFIRYADGDRLNLRRENLSTEKPVRPGPRVKRKTPREGLVRQPRTPKVLKAAASRSTRAPRAKTPPVSLSAFFRARESCPEISASPPPSIVAPPKVAPSRPVPAPRTEAPPVPSIPAPAPSTPPTALFVKRKPPVVATVKRPGKPLA